VCVRERELRHERARGGDGERDSARRKREHENKKYETRERMSERASERKRTILSERERGKQAEKESKCVCI